MRSLHRHLAASILLIATVALGQSAGPQAQQRAPFEKPPLFSVAPQFFTDRQVTELLTTLDAMLAEPGAERSAGQDSRTTLTDFTRRLQAGRLTGAQERRVVDHLAEIAREHPDDAAVPAARSTIQALTPGKVAPDIVGTDVDGAPLRLSDYRGKVVVLMFWGQWCGICRTQYPYERLLLELYKNWPFAILGINSDRTRDIARQAGQENQLTYRSWWDGPVNESTPGSIASAWNVTGWPTVYVLDGRGVIRYVDLTSEDLLKAVRELLMEPSRPQPRPR